jgi:hypothetical protein
MGAIKYNVDRKIKNRVTLKTSKNYYAKKN